MDQILKYQREFIQRIIDRCGPRLPGSEEENRASGIIADEFMSVTGNAVVEEFSYAAKACIGAIPAIGAGLMIAGLFFFWLPLVTLILTAALLIFAVPQIILYREWFDRFSPKSTSHNVYSIIDPPGGAKYVRATLVLSAHIDSSWHCPPFAEKSHLARYKLNFGVISAILLLLLSAARLGGAEFLGLLPWPMWWTMVIVPFLFPGFFFLFRYLVYDKSVASPGAMDDLSGIAVNLGLAKIYRAQRKKRPRNIRILLVAFGAEEAGLKGSRAFIRRHRDDLLAGDVWVLNVDGVADKDEFLCIEGEAWQMVWYDREYVEMVESIMKGMGLSYNRWIMDAGGTDGAEFVKAGIGQAITVVAQDRTPRFNYHTRFDTLEHLDPEAMRLMNDLCMNIVETIDIKVAGKS
ncbi:MAG: M28 family peptidase [Spirochaetes bacterium]|nr:M28 family peptidase [Spirochaetota bacterium]